MRKKLIWLFVALLCMQVSSVCAQSLKKIEKSIEKEKKEQIKALIKEHGYTSVKVIAPNSSYWYYLVTKKDPIQRKLVGVLAPDESVLIPVQYFQVDYFPALTEGKSPIARYDARFKRDYSPYMLYHKESPAIFVASSNGYIDFYATNGNLLNQCKGTSYKYLPGYFVIDAGKIDDFPSLESYFTIVNAKYLLQQDGSIMVSNFKNFRFIQNKNYCPYSQIQTDGVERKGVYFINDPNSNIPPVFHDINWNTKEVEEVGWKVMRTSSSVWEIYDPLKNYTICYKDNGEFLFDKMKYDEVISYYKSQNSTDPFAKYLTALSLFELAEKQIDKIPSFYRDVVETKVYFTLSSVRKEYEQYTFDIKLAESMFQTCCILLNAYLEEDSTYAEKAKIRLKVANNRINKTISKYEEMYRTACSMIGEYNREREEKIANAFASLVTGVTENLIKDISTSNAKQPVVSNSNKLSSTSGSSSTTSSQNSELSSGVQDRIRQLERNIKNETTYLENAQKRYESNPTALAKREIEAHKRAIEGYKKQIEDLKNGR